MILDHFGFGVSDYPRAKVFYAQALAPLGVTVLMEFGPEQTEGKVWACGSPLMRLTVYCGSARPLA